MTRLHPPAATLLNEGSFRLLLLWSLAGHLLLAVSLWVTPSPRRRDLPPAPVYVEVIPREGARPGAEVPRQVIDEPVAIPPEARAKPARKPRPVHRARPARKPRPRVQPTPEQLLAQIRRKVGDRPEPPGASAPAATGTGARAGILDRERAVYDRRVKALLWANWAGVSAFSGRRGLVARFSVRLSPEGEVLEIDLLDSSGDRFLDESAERAIRRTDPFPRPPPGYTQLGLRFDPSERF